MIENDIKKKVGTFLKQVGLNDEQSTIYLYLQENGPSSVLSISRGLGTGRTRLYPALESMVQLQVIAARPRHFGTLYEGLPPENLEFLVSEYERKASAVRHNLTFAVHALNNIRVESPNNSRVIEFHGIEGLKQVNYNLLKAKNGYYVFEKANMDQHKLLPKHFVEKFRQTQVDRHITSHDLTNNPNWKEDTNIKELSEFSKVHYIEPDIFEIRFEMFIYNNVVTLVNHDPNDIVCIEVHNQALADQQKQLFDLLWRMGSPLKNSVSA